MQVKALIAFFVAVVVLVLGWFLVSPLFIDEAVDEAFPVPSSMPTRIEVDAMSSAEREAAMQAVMAEVRSKPDTVMREPMTGAAEPQLLASGSFRDADAIHKGTGRALVYALPDGSRLLRFEDFRVTNGPALVVALAEAKAPRDADDVLAGYREIAALKGNVGDQNYTLPQGLDLERYGSVVIWCTLFDVLFSPASLGGEDQQ